MTSLCRGLLKGGQSLGQAEIQQQAFSFGLCQVKLSKVRSADKEQGASVTQGPAGLAQAPKNPDFACWYCCTHQVCNVHWHLVNLSTVVLLNIPQNSDVV